MGVDAIGPGGPVSLSADRIVLCAGAIQSAHLLMLSGVGEEEVLRSAGVKVLMALPVGMGCSDHPEWVMPTNWAVAVDRPVLEVLLSTHDGIEIRPYTGGFVAMTGDGTAGHRDWPHIGVALMQPRARGRITLVSVIPRYQSASSTDTTVNLPMSRPCARVAHWPTNYAVRQRASVQPYGRHRSICVVVPQWAPTMTHEPSSTRGVGSAASKTYG